MPSLPDPQAVGVWFLPKVLTWKECSWLLASLGRVPLSQEAGRDREEMTVEADMLG